VTFSDFAKFLTTWSVRGSSATAELVALKGTAVNSGK